MAGADEDVYRLEASVPTGLECGAVEECEEALGRPAVSTRGRLSFTLSALKELDKVGQRHGIMVVSYFEMSFLSR
jgi:hypothetical protein